MTLPSNRPWLEDLIRGMPIGRKLLLITMATTFVALLLAGAGIVLADAVLFRGYLERDLSALGRITADNSTAALTFEDPASASEILHALRARPHLVAACIYRPNGTELARYIRPRSPHEKSGAGCPPMDSRDEIRFGKAGLTLTRPVVLDNRVIGSLALVYDLGESTERIRIYGGTVLAVFLASSLIALLLSSRLRAIIATPVAQLVQTSQAVSRTNDYSIRARKLSNDELGVLVDAFNQMLAAIQSRDSELKEALIAREEALRESRHARDQLARLNADLARSNEKLAQSNEDLERFAFVASHDLQEPLRMISLFSQLLVRSYTGQGGEEAAGWVANIVAGVRRIRNLLTDLLAYTDIGAPAAGAAQAVDLNGTVTHVLENLRASIQETGATVTVEPLPTLRVHEGHFTSLFQNLISNALKYRSEEPPEIHVTFERVTSESGNEWLRFAVIDNGIGIDPEYHAKIFVAFKRLHGHNIAGTGIGLAICQRVVDRYRGKIHVESEAGKGAAFIFTLPAELAGEPVSMEQLRIEQHDENN